VLIAVQIDIEALRNHMLMYGELETAFCEVALTNSDDTIRSKTAETRACALSERGTQWDNSSMRFYVDQQYELLEIRGYFLHLSRSSLRTSALTLR
jgi:hypothetical protein